MPPAPRTRSAYTEREVRGNKDLATAINESAFIMDEQILDPDSPLAVQIPEGVGADGSSITLALAETYAEGNVEDRFENGSAPLPIHSDPESSDNKDGVRSVADEPEKKPGSFDRVDTYPVHNVPAVRREAAEGGENVNEDSMSEDEVRESDKPKVPAKAETKKGGEQPDPTDKKQVEEAKKPALGEKK